MKVIVTGAAGFIGSNIVKALNARGVTDIVAVDNLTRAEKMPNLADCEIADYLDKVDFIERVRADELDADVARRPAPGRLLRHHGDGRPVHDGEQLPVLAGPLDWCQRFDIPYIYASSASVYGAGRVFRESREHEGPLNVYGYSKFLFDQVVRRRLAGRTAQIAGFRYFNVYGPRESHKGRMASVAFHFFNQYVKEGRVRLFEGADGYGPGEQIRDFVSVEDAVRVNLFFLDHPEISGIFNVGTGAAQSFNDVACAAVNACAGARGEAPLTLAQLREAGTIEYIAFPPQLVGKYQSFTQADVSSLRAAGYGVPFLSVEEGVGRYVAARVEREGLR